VAGGSLREAVASATEDPVVLRAGRVLARTRVHRERVPEPPRRRLGVGHASNHERRADA